MDKEENSYEFTSDWFTPKVKIFEKYLGHLSDEANLNFLEIGSYEGRSACWLLDNILTDPSSYLTCVDPFWTNTELAFDENVLRTGRKHQVTKIKGCSDPSLLSLQPESFDFIYVDGDHKAPGVLFDVTVSFALLKPGGLMMLDDYLWKTSDPAIGPLNKPKISIDAFINIYSEHIELMHHQRQIVFRKKTQ